ncbi:hypothetical protein QBC37DRAFT_404332 [Rhypophila decipiens]|uniref:Uncharacterized protein n=1 Tax=Rhypophila decipiens TaxID=261697 RepID=A0AAN6Y138_9PEZI|nr:hypothetical protein QBC37DRAFT_404332 [Rhypophila decipiens]
MKPSPKVLLLPAFARLAMSKTEHRGGTKVQCPYVNELGNKKLCLPMCNPCSSSRLRCARIWAIWPSDYDYRSCACPMGYKPFAYDHNARPNCDPMASCVGYTELDETHGSRVVVSPSSLPDVKHLISCISSTAVPIGLLSEKRTALNIQSTARRGKSVGLTPAKDISDYQIGHAVDPNLILPYGAACPRDNCMDLAFCAFHPTRKSCVAIYKRHRPQKKANNRWINSLLTCAGSSGMNMGALFSVGD